MNLFRNLFKNCAALVTMCGVLMVPLSLQADTASVKAQLKKMIGQDAESADIKETPIKGLYQVQVGLTLVHMSADGQFMLNGSLIDLKDNQNLTQLEQAKTRKIMLDALPEEDMIVYPATNPKYTITVFTDIDCPYCRKLHEEIPTLNKAGVTVRYLAFPRSGVMDAQGNLQASYQKSVSVWCAKDRAQTMTDAMNGLPPETQNCSNPVIKHLTKAEEFNVTGTPNIIFDDGRIVGGYAPAEELLKLLSQS